MLIKLKFVSSWCLLSPPGGHPGLCQSLPRHLRVLGLRLPAGSHLPDTSLLLGRHQSQLPREQLCLGCHSTRWHSTGWHRLAQHAQKDGIRTPLLPLFLFTSFFMSFRFCTGQRLGLFDAVWSARTQIQPRVLGVLRNPCKRMIEIDHRIDFQILGIGFR